MLGTRPFRLPYIVIRKIVIPASNTGVRNFSWTVMRCYLIPSFLALLVASSFLSVSLGYSSSAMGPFACTAKPQISSVTPITTNTLETIVIKGSNFCTKPSWELGHGWFTYACTYGVKDPSINITDKGTGNDHSNAARESCTGDFGINGPTFSAHPVWTNSQITFYGFSSELGNSSNLSVYNIQKGDHITITIYSCNQKCSASFTTTVK
jgi:hypothetical protein